MLSHGELRIRQELHIKKEMCRLETSLPVASSGATPGTVHPGPTLAGREGSEAVANAGLGAESVP